jgi:shikimate kinase
MAAQTVFLIGFMGSGKTTTGKKLAHKLGLAFCDLDEELCRKFAVPSISILIGQHGFETFREAETETLKNLNLKNALISTGGGTPCYFDNMQWMKSRGVVVFFEVNEGVLFSRLKTEEQSERPLLKDLDDEQLMSFIHTKLEERLPFYRQAHITFNPVTEKMETLVEEVERVKI